MQLEQLVPSLELCERLKELRYPQNDSLFYWIKEIGSNVWSLCYRENLEVGKWLADDIAIAAPISSELGEFLSIAINDEKLVITKASFGWLVGYSKNPANDEWEYWKCCGTIAEVFALMLIWLVENGHVSFKYV